MLARETDRLRRQLPQIIGVAPARDDAPCEFLRQDNVCIERQVRAMLLDRADRQAQDRACAQAL